MKREIDKAINGLKSFGMELFDEEEMRFNLERLLLLQDKSKSFVYSGVELELKEWGIYVWFKGPDHKKTGLIYRVGAFNEDT